MRAGCERLNAKGLYTSASKTVRSIWVGPLAVISTNSFEWWRGAALYQIYPRSFFDYSGDGTGDLRGITEKLHYVADLGVDGVWISPFFTSPMHDFGYDVSDFCSVDPSFGNLTDFDALIDRAHNLGLKVVIDQVYSHSSSEHPWFVSSRSSRNNDKSDWYVWADARPEGSPPNNWQSIFGGPAWTWDARRQQYYLHNFLSSQPDLNLHNPEVQDALLSVAKFWLERGVDGFRLDAINYGMHNVELPDNPVADPGHWSGLRPVDMQKAINNSNHRDLPNFLERIRALTDQYPARFTVAEVGGSQTLNIRQEYTKGEARLNTAYGFEFLYLPELDVEAFAQIIGSWSNDPDRGWPSWAFSNHDVPRVHSRWLQHLDDIHRAKLLALLLISLRGNLFIYQGEELGLPQVEIPFDLLKDPEALRNWPHTLSRDGARTPMPWLGAAEHGGFTVSTPWLPVPECHKQRAVDSVAGAELREHLKRLLSIRNACPELRWGDLNNISGSGDVLRFQRSHDGQCVQAVFNFSEETVVVPETEIERSIMIVGQGDSAEEFNGELPPFSGALYYVSARHV